MSFRILRWFLALLLLLFVVVFVTTRIAAPALPAGVKKEFRTLHLAGKEVILTFYLPANRTEAPWVVVAHGFTRNKHYMAGWGTALAREGFIAVTLTQPAISDHRVNAAAIADLIAQLRHTDLHLPVKPGPRGSLMGFSMGGFTTFLTMKKEPVEAWVGLDPVAMNGVWPDFAKSLNTPCAILRAEPAAVNLSGNALSLVTTLVAPKLAVKVTGATHLDAESPTDILGQWLLGRVDPQRHETFERYAIAFLKSVQFEDAAAKQVIAQAAADTSLSEVVMTMQ